MKKLTAQRQAVLNMINQSNHHWDAEALARALSDAGHSIGIATIYRGLTALEHAGLVQVIHLGDKKRYERSDKDHHDHLICRLCGSIEEFFDEAIEQRQRDVAQRHNFDMDAHQLLIFGTCEACCKRIKEGEKV